MKKLFLLLVVFTAAPACLGMAAVKKRIFTAFSPTQKLDVKIDIKKAAPLQPQLPVEPKIERSRTGVVVEAPDGWIENLTKINADLLAAVKEQRTADVQNLLDKGADCTITENGTPLIQLAIVAGAFKIAELLMEEGADPTATDREENTALHKAVQNVSANTFLAFLIKKWDGNLLVCNRKGQTALHKAAESNNSGAVCMLLAAADISNCFDAEKENGSARSN